MSQYDSGPISQLPPGISVLSTDIYPATDITDLTESPSGTTKKYSIAQLTQFLSNSFLTSNIKSARVCSTSSLNAVYVNGVSGVGATLTNSGSIVPLVLDGISLSVGDRVLVPFQSTQYENGVYQVTNDGSSSPWVMTRVSDFDGSSAGEINQGDFIGIFSGNRYGLTFWFMTSNTPLAVGVDSIIFEELSAAGIIPPNTVQVYVSKKIGSDLVGDGSFVSPFATINAAKTNAISLGGLVNIVIIDSETYDEQLDFSSTGGINLIGPTCIISYSGSGDALTGTGGMLINLGVLECTGGGNALVNPGGELYCNIVLSLAGNVVNSGSEYTLIQAYRIDGNITNTGGGTTRYTTLLPRGGTDDANTFGLNTEGSSNNFNVGGLLSVQNNYTFPATDGAPFQFIQTNGAGILSFQSISGLLSSVNTQIFISSGTYTPTPGMVYALVEVIGGGGGGGGCDGTTGISGAAGGGGGSGSYSKSYLSAATIGVSQAVTIGLGGSGGAAGNNNGSNGGVSSFGSLVTANGGGAGLGSIDNPGINIYGFGGPGAAAGTGDLAIPGNGGGTGIIYASNYPLSGIGAGSFYGAQTQISINAAGQNGNGYGCGGGGGSSAAPTQPAQPGGNGSDGIVIITEYIVL